MKHSVYLILITLFLFTCTKEENKQSTDLLFPVGRSILIPGDVKVSVNGASYTPTVLDDSCGGYWIKIPKSDLPASGTITILFTRRKMNLDLFRDAKIPQQPWLTASPYIDVANEVLKAKALELTKDVPSTLNKAKQIHLFVSNYLQLQFYHDAFMDKASRTYGLRYGECMNFSRLFIALCRAVNIPARSVWGVIYGYNNDSIYDYHHQWVEVADENGYWHPADFKYNPSFDLNDVRYLDLIYAAEENTLIKHRLPGQLVAGQVEYFNDYPATLTGRLGFELVEDRRPEYMSVKYVYSF